MYASWTESRLRGEMQDDEEWGNLAKEPRGVDYIELDAGGMPAMWAVPKGSATDHVVFGIHGGGYIGGSLYTHRKLFAHVAKAIGARALLVEYGHTPEHKHPAQVGDTTNAYAWLLDQGIRPEHVAFLGDSAGGALALTTQLRAREQGLPLPAAAMLLSPWVDLELTGETYETNKDTEAYFYKDVVHWLVGIFLGDDGDPRDPLANPLYADLTGFGPMYIQVGGDETLVDDGRMLEQHARKSGVDVRFDLFPDQQHTFQMAAGRAPEADEAIRMLAEWARPKMGL